MDVSRHNDESANQAISRASDSDKHISRRGFVRNGALLGLSLPLAGGLISAVDVSDASASPNQPSPSRNEQGQPNPEGPRTIDGVTVSGTPISGQVLTATSDTTAKWSSLAVVNVNDFGADPTGLSDSTKAFNDAIASLPTYLPPDAPSGFQWTPMPIGTIVVPSGQYKIGSQGVDIANIGPAVTIVGMGRSATTFFYYGKTSAFRCYNPNLPQQTHVKPGYQAIFFWGGGLRNIGIDGTHAQPGAVGIWYGGLEGALFSDLLVQHFNSTANRTIDGNPGSAGIFGEGDPWWAEKCDVREVIIKDCTYGLVIAGRRIGGYYPGLRPGGSRGYCDYDIVFFGTNQTAILVTDEATAYHNHIHLRANMVESGSLVYIGGSANLVRSYIEIDAECVPPAASSITVEDGSHFADMTGSMQLNNFLGATYAGTPVTSNTQTPNFSFYGFITGDPNLAPNGSIFLT